MDNELDPREVVESDTGVSVIGLSLKKWRKTMSKQVLLDRRGFLRGGASVAMAAHPSPWRRFSDPLKRWRLKPVKS